MKSGLKRYLLVVGMGTRMAAGTSGPEPPKQFSLVFSHHETANSRLPKIALGAAPAYPKTVCRTAFGIPQDGLPNRPRSLKYKKLNEKVTIARVHPMGIFGGSRGVFDASIWRPWNVQERFQGFPGRSRAGSPGTDLGPILDRSGTDLRPARTPEMVPK